MKRLTLIKSAIDFAFANYQSGAIELAEKSLASFKAANGVDADLPIWNQNVTQFVNLAAQLSKQKLPSEVLAAVPAEAPEALVSNATQPAKAP